MNPARSDFGFTEYRVWGFSGCVSCHIVAFFNRGRVYELRAPDGRTLARVIDEEALEAAWRLLVSTMV